MQITLWSCFFFFFLKDQHSSPLCWLEAVWFSHKSFGGSFRFCHLVWLHHLRLFQQVSRFSQKQSCRADYSYLLHYSIFIYRRLIWPSLRIYRCSKIYCHWRSKSSWDDEVIYCKMFVSSAHHSVLSFCFIYWEEVSHLSLTSVWEIHNTSSYSGDNYVWLCPGEASQPWFKKWRTLSQALYVNFQRETNYLKFSKHQTTLALMVLYTQSILEFSEMRPYFILE